MKLGHMALLAIVGLAPALVHADTITNFLAAGTFRTGSLLSGTLSIDTTTGTVTAADLTLGAPDSLTLNVIQMQSANQPFAGTYGIEVGSSASGPPSLFVFLPVLSLAGYSGSTIDSTTQPGANAEVSNLQASLYNDDLSVGRLTPSAVTTVPEPASVWLCLAAFGLTGLLWSRRFRLPGQQNFDI